jgi:hypothetical protein
MITRVLMTVGALLGVGAAAVQAHEVRQIGAYTLVIGFRAEPAFEDVVNAVDIFINRSSDGNAIVVAVRGGHAGDLGASAVVGPLSV